MNHIDILLCNYDRKLLEMLTGKLLGDGNIIIQKNRKPRFRFGHSIKDRDWCVHCYQKLANFLRLNPPKYRRVFDSRIKEGFADLYYVQSKTEPIYIHLKEIWYNSTVKIIPKEFVEKLMTPLSLAWWYQDDGHLKMKGKTPQKIILSTESFSHEEILFLHKLLFNKFHLNFSIDNDKRLVLYNQRSILAFLNLVRPYLSKGMKRKDIYLGNLKKEDLPLKKRTTVYLLERIALNKPTAEIKKLCNSLPDTISIIEPRLHHFLNMVEKKRDNPRKSYQIELKREELLNLAIFQQKTGYTMGEAIELCYEYINGLLK
jgi:hypothetical protein